jgi:hypothetical protein
LSERMRVPGGASSGFECDVSSGNERRIRSGEKWVDANGSGEPVRRPFGGRLRTASCDFHGPFLRGGIRESTLALPRHAIA